MVIETNKNNNFTSRANSNPNHIVSQPFPEGVKCHMYKDLLEDHQKSHKNQWKNIYALMGVQVGQNQNIISEILDSYYKQNEMHERIYTKFQRGERVEHEDLKEDPPGSRI